MNKIEQRINPFLRFSVDKVLPFIFPFEFNQESLIYADQIEEHLKNGSVLAYFNQGRFSNKLAITKAMCDLFGKKISIFKEPKAQEQAEYHQQIEKLLNIPGSFVIIATKSINNQPGLENSEPELSQFHRFDRNILYVPVGLLYPKHNLTKIIIGKPFDYEEAKHLVERETNEFSVEEVMVVRLAQLLPEAQQGNYKERVEILKSELEEADR